MNAEFKAYYEELNSRPHFTPLTEEEENEYFAMAQKPKSFSLEKAKQHPFTWAYHVVRIMPRDYQFKMLDYMFKYGRVATVTSRQIGKSTVCALYAFWAAYTNAYPSGPKKDTKILITSHTEQAAKDLLRVIDSFISMADETMALYTKDMPHYNKQYFKSKIKLQNQFEIHFPKGSIKIYPPTAKVRGNSADVLLIDEAHWLHNPDPDYFFASDAMPTVTATNGKVFLFSTPKNMAGFFFEVINPTKDEALKGWKRLWFPWTIVQNPKQQEQLWTTRDSYLAKGDELDFKIEYEADFLSGKHTFFNSEILETCVDESLREEFSWPTPVTMGLDFGDVHSRTVLSVVHHDREKNETKLIWYKEFPQGYNNADIVDFVVDLKKRGRFIPKEIVVDDCVGGKTAIELLKRKGFNIKPFVFVKSKNEYYEYMKVAFANQRIKMYKEPTLFHQLNSLEAVELPSGRTQIRKPNGGRDDIVDSLMMACSPFIQPKGERKWRFGSDYKPGSRKPRVTIR